MLSLTAVQLSRLLVFTLRLGNDAKPRAHWMRSFILAASLAVAYITRPLIGRSSQGSLCAGTGLVRK